MLGHRELNFEDYMAILRRRRWIILIPMVVAPLVTYLVSLTLSDRYTSRTLVLVEQQKVPDSVVKSVVTEDLAQRLASMEEQILSRTRLQPIIEKFGLFKEDAGKLHMEDMVDRLRKSIEVTPIRPMTGTRSEELPGFYISFTAGNARLAQQVCAEITSMFIEENLRAREQRSQGTTEFLSHQLEDAKRKLDDQDAKLAVFKQKYFGSLPGQEQSNISILAGLNSQFDAVTQALGRAQQDRAYADSLLSQQLSQLESTPTASAGPEPDSLEKQLAELQNQLLGAQARYTDDHPDVIKLKLAIADLKRKIEDSHAQNPGKPESAEAKPTRQPTPQIQQLRATVHQLEQTIQQKTKEQAQIREQIGLYQGRLSMSPGVEQQYKELTRDYQTALAFYNDLLAKESESQMSTNLERRQQGEQFRVMDPANLPESPSFPNRPLFAAAGLGVGLAIGLGITILLEAKDKALRTDNDVKFFLQVPTLAMIPNLEVGNPKRGWFWRRAKTPEPSAGLRAEA
ncbi:MAG: lipopolysaccharide biosynthesis protein [Acidobacteriia bacterium]|nr:lipopolysaccharide biosynthesis protein [Terriglobia bacterium]